MSNIRLISIHDQIDTGNQLFPETKTSDVLAVIAMLPKEVMAIRKAALHAQRLKYRMPTISTKSVAKSDRNKRIINMYLHGVSLDDIFAMSGFTSRSSVFRILNDAKIELTRGRTRGPLGPRKKKEEREADNENEKEGDAE
jgi:hypothetical protein